jgi:uncharacterized membrane protein
MARKPARRRKAPPKQSLLQRLRGNFLTGLVVVLPVFLTVYLVWATIGFVDARVIPLIPNRYNPENVFGRNIFGFGVVVFLVFTTLVGAVTKGYIGRRILQTGERMVERMPIVRTIYNGLKQIAETIFSQTSNSFQTACIIEYPRRGLWSVAFVSTDTLGEIRHKSGEDDLVSVFLPSTPNPTTGFLLFVPRSDVRVLDMSVEEAAKLIISAGLVEPDFPRARARPQDNGNGTAAASRARRARPEP